MQAQTRFEPLGRNSEGEEGPPPRAQAKRLPAFALCGRGIGPTLRRERCRPAGVQRRRPVASVGESPSLFRRTEPVGSSPLARLSAGMRARAYGGPTFSAVIGQLLEVQGGS